MSEKYLVLFFFYFADFKRSNLGRHEKERPCLIYFLDSVGQKTTG